MDNQIMERERVYRSIAKKLYDDVIPLYQNVNKFTKPFSDTNEEMFTKNSTTINAFIYTQVEGFTNYIMNTLIPRGVEWGKCAIDEDLISLISIESKSEVVKDNTIDTVKKDLERANHKLFKLLNDSNYFDEINNAVWDCVTCGTGVFKINNTNDPVTPFSFKRVTLSNLELAESVSGKINRVYKLLKNYNYDMITEEFTDGIEWIYGDKLASNKHDFYEVIFPNGENFVRMITDTSLDKVFYQEKLTYNPYVIFRFKKHPVSPYGIGQGLICYDKFLELERFEEMDREQVDTLIKPPLIAYGDPKLFQNLKLKAGKINYGGLNGDMANALRVNQAIPDYKYQVLETEINQARQDIRLAFMTNPLGEIEDAGKMTATESSIRASQFRTQFAGLYERLVRELLNNLYMNCLKIMQVNSIIDIENQFMDIAKLTYSNAIADNFRTGEVSKLIGALDIATNIFGFDARQVLVKKEKVRDYIVNTIECNIEALNSNEETIKAMEEIEMARQQMLQEQMMLERAKKVIPENVEQ